MMFDYYSHDYDLLRPSRLASGSAHRLTALSPRVPERHAPCTPSAYCTSTVTARSTASRCACSPRRRDPAVAIFWCKFRCRGGRGFSGASASGAVASSGAGSGAGAGVGSGADSGAGSGAGDATRSGAFGAGAGAGGAGAVASTADGVTERAGSSARASPVRVKSARARA